MVANVITKAVSSMSRVGKQALIRPAFHGNNLRPLVQDTVQFSEKPILSDLGKVLESYNLRKLTPEGKQYVPSQTILDNWKQAFGVANKDGVYENAVEYLRTNGSFERYIAQRCPDLKLKEDIELSKSLLEDYLKKNLDIFSYERIDKILRGFNKSISQKIKDGAVIYIPDEHKSYSIINALYRKINPNGRTITGYNKLKEYAATHPNLDIIVLDDCLVSGKSVGDIYKGLHESGLENIRNVDFYHLTAFQDGINYVNELKAGIKGSAKGLNIHYDGVPKAKLRNSDYFRHEVNDKHKGLLLALLGTGGSSSNVSAYSSVMFPYMSPNNNSLFSAHMIRDMFSGPECAIKCLHSDAETKASETILRICENLRKAS